MQHRKKSFVLCTSSILLTTSFPSFHQLAFKDESAKSKSVSAFVTARRGRAYVRHRVGKYDPGDRRPADSGGNVNFTKNYQAVNQSIRSLAQSASQNFRELVLNVF